ncbi:MAG TPA: alpha/beta hydrolase [Motilibacteraceae bacterium]|nr:alpha/beta hydrolase [Motilibacteraceae bacterium]
MADVNGAGDGQSAVGETLPEPAPLGPVGPPAGAEDLDVAGRGVRLRATRWAGEGAGARGTVLLLHGLASQRRFWNLVAPRVAAAGYDVVALDQRGHGDAERPPAGPYDVTTCADDAVAALDGLGVRKAVVVGHSWGAWVALTVAARHPERVQAVLAVDGGTATPGGGGPREEVRKRLEPPRFALPPEELAAMLARGALGPWWSPQLEAALLPGFGVGADGLARARLRFDLHLQVLDGLLDAGMDDVLPAVVAPAWVVSCEPLPVPHGATDPSYPDESWRRAREEGLERAARLLPRARILRWAGALHDVPLQWPALVAGTVLAAADEALSEPGTVVDPTTGGAG